jgi:HAD superfamily hydrolase (TIGR01509 family)
MHAVSSSFGSNCFIPTTGGKSTGVNTIIFDLGRVLIDFDHRIAAKKIARFADKDEDGIISLFFDSDITMSFEEGRLSPHQFFLKVKEVLNLKLDYEDFVPIWQEIFFFSEKNRQVHALALALKERYRVALLSNINALHFDYIKKAFTIFNAFHNIITSFELGYIKPNPLIYQKALEILKCTPNQTFYTDDRPELVTSARGLGIQGFVFSGIEQLKKNLLDSGVKI